MTQRQVIALLDENRNERGMANWQKLGNPELKSFGIGLTQLRKLAKKVGRDHDLALELWNSNVYDAKVIGALIDEPKKITRPQAETQVEEVGHWMLAHVYCSCDATLAKSPIARELAVDWTDSKDDLRRRCGYLLLYELAKNTKDEALSDDFFEGYVDRIRKSIQNEENFVKDAMNNSLLSIGKRNARLNKLAIAAAKAIGPIEVDYGDNSCRPMDVLKHLNSDLVQKKLRA
jgi:3-methyladenine DNA glycosylase AlkD